jgi:hypothetical protein
MNRLPTSPLIMRGLEIAETTIRAWRLGHATMPEYKFLRLVDILTVLDPKWTDEAKPKP